MFVNVPEFVEVLSWLTLEILTGDFVGNFDFLQTQHASILCVIHKLFFQSC